MRRREIKRHAVQGLCDSGMMGELFSSVRRKAFYRLPLQYLKQYRIDGLCCLFGCFASYQIPALSIYQRNQTGFSCLSCYDITFPMSSPGAVSGSCWPFRNIVRDGNRTPSFLILPGMPGRCRKRRTHRRIRERTAFHQTYRHIWRGKSLHS